MTAIFREAVQRLGRRRRPTIPYLKLPKRQADSRIVQLASGFLNGKALHLQGFPLADL